MNKFRFLLVSALSLGVLCSFKPGLAQTDTDTETELYLSIDGGGVLDFLPALLLKDIELKTNRPLYQIVNGIAGSSGGAIIAALAATPSPLKENGQPTSGAEIANFFEQKSFEIFLTAGSAASGILEQFLPSVGTLDPTLMLRKNLEDGLGNRLLSQALVPLWISAFDLTRNDYFIFDSESAKGNLSMNAFIRSAVLASSSIERLFGITEVQFGDNQIRRFIDTGSDTLPSYQAEPTSDPTSFLEKALEQKLAGTQKKAIIVSIGTGFSVRKATQTTGTEKVTVIRLEPDLSATEEAKYIAANDRLAMLISGISLFQTVFTELKDVAETLKKTPEYERALALFQQRAVSVSSD